MIESVAPNIDNAREWQLHIFVCWGHTREQPVYDRIMCEFEDELIDHAIDADCTADKLQLRVLGVAEDKVVCVEVGEIFAADTSCNLDDPFVSERL